MNIFKEKLDQIKVMLGLQEVKLAESLLEDGVTKVTADVFEPGNLLSVVSETGETAPAPEGTHTLEDGTKVTVDADGKILSVETPETEEEPAVEVEVEMTEEVIETELAEEAPVEEVPVEDPNAEILNMVKQCMEAIETVATEVGNMKTEMAAYKSKFETMSKTPAAGKIKTFNADGESEKIDPIEAKALAIQKLRGENFFKTNK